MMNNCSTSQTNGFSVFRGSDELWLVLGVLSGVLVFSLCWNILCCVHKHWTAKGKAFFPRFRRSTSLKQEMEDNPIYGNITYTQTSVYNNITCTQTRHHKEEEHASQTSSSGRECYANLTLKVPKSASGRSSPVSQTQYSDVKAVCETIAEPEGNTEEKDTCSLVSELYASVDTEHVNRKKQGNSEAYANHV